MKKGVKALSVASLCGAALWPASLTARCRVDGPATKLVQVPEASGITSSRTVAGRLWALNDSGQPLLFALDARGAVTGQLRVSGAHVEDWEAVAVAPCASGSCIYVADIGDNDAARTHISIYRVAEPTRLNATAPAELFKAAYPDGSHDAEGFLAMPDGSLYVITKGSTGPIALYRFPRRLRSGAVMMLERVGTPKKGHSRRAGDWITDAAVSHGGTRIALRTHHALFVYTAAALLAGEWKEEERIDLDDLGEPQGEGVSFGTDDAIYLVGEGGSRSKPGTFGRLACTPAR